MRSQVWTKGLLCLAAVLILGVLGTSSANAQVWGYPPVIVGGGFDMFGNSHWVYSSRLNPGANIAIPGTGGNFTRFVPGVGWVGGNRYLGADGQWHGTTSVLNGDGTSTNVHYSRAPVSRGGSYYRPNTGAPRTYR